MRNTVPLMKISNRRACMRYVSKRLKEGSMTLHAAQVLTPIILAGLATRPMVYGFHPTKKAA